MATKTTTATTRTEPAFPVSLGALRHALEEIAEKVGVLPPTPIVRSLELRADSLRREARLLPDGGDDRLPALIDAAVSLESEVASLWKDAGNPRAGTASTLVPW